MEEGTSVLQGAVAPRPVQPVERLGTPGVEPPPQLRLKVELVSWDLEVVACRAVAQVPMAPRAVQTVEGRAVPM